MKSLRINPTKGDRLRGNPRGLPHDLQFAREPRILRLKPQSLERRFQRLRIKPLQIERFEVQIVITPHHKRPFRETRLWQIQFRKFDRDRLSLHRPSLNITPERQPKQTARFRRQRRVQQNSQLLHPDFVQRGDLPFQRLVVPLNTQHLPFRGEANIQFKQRSKVGLDRECSLEL